MWVFGLSSKTQDYSRKATSLHLICDEGFALSFAMSLVGIAIVSRILVIQESLSDHYESARMVLLESAHRYEAWAVVSLLASSCCALQVVLNILSAGCAGFNKLLGPARPLLLACAFALQFTAWREVQGRPFLWRPTFFGTLLTGFLSLSPEILHCVSILRGSKRSSDSLASTAPKAPPSFVLDLTSSIGCSSCEVTVQSTVASHPSVSYCAVSDGFASVYLKTSTDDTRNEICNLLDKAGFPVKERNS